MNTNIAGSTVRAGYGFAYEYAPYLAFALFAAAELAAIGLLNGGLITYPLDDAYIHLALAERIAHGTYGINPGEFAAPASSVLWPFLLSLFAQQSFMMLVPVVINLAIALCTLVVMSRITYRALNVQPREAGSLWVAAFVTLLIPATNLLGLALTGMEHSLQQFLAVAVVAGLIEEPRSRRAPAYLWIALVLLPVVRFDSLALSVPALVYLSWRGRLTGTLLSALILAGILCSFSWFLHSHGAGFLPTSVTAKAGFMSLGGPVRALFVALYTNVVDEAQGNLLLLGAMLLIITALSVRRPAPERGLAATIAAAVLLHLMFGKVGAYFRYEAYLAAAVLVTLVQLYRDWLAAALVSPGSTALRAAALGCVAVISIGYSFALLATPLGANNIYSQQYQMHRFAVDYYKGPVAVNDLGWVAFRNPHYVLDLFGLGSIEAQYARLHESSGSWMDRLCKEHGVELIMIYDDWFPNRPSSWIRLGSLKLLRAKITPSGPEVQFYARGAEAAARARGVLPEFARSLPSSATFIPAVTTAPDATPR